MPQVKSHRSSYLSLTILVVALGVLLCIILNRQTIIDTVRAAQYRPSTAAIQLRDELRLTDKGTQIFNASRPDLESSTGFNQSCQQNKETNNPILGCYVDEQIFIFNITNKKLGGIKETTAAHELLHAVYERMSAHEKESVNQELKKAYERVKTPELEQRMAYYQKSEPGQELNELHSILGTEDSDLGTSLEQHYAQYFTNRKTVVAYYKAYDGVFTSATTQIKSLRSQINQTITDINSRIERYNSDNMSFESAVNAFKSRYDNGEYNSQAAIDAEQSKLASQQSALKTTRAGIISSINGVKKLKDTLASVVKEYNQLSQSINSSVTTTPSL